jgi:excisionase family DNA binding protein
MKGRLKARTNLEIEIGVPIAFTVKQVAVILNCSRSQVYVLMNTGALKSAKVAGGRRITQNQLLEYIRSIEQ